MSIAASAREPLDTLLANLTGEHEPHEFWGALCKIAIQATDAAAACFVTQPNPDAPWQVLTTSDVSQFEPASLITGIATQALSNGEYELRTIEGNSFVAGRLNQPDASRQIVVILRLHQHEMPAGIKATLTILKVAISQNISERRLAHLKVEHDSFQQAFDIGERLSAATSKAEGWLSLCNALAEHLQADRVSAGFIQNTTIDIRATSGKHNMSAATEWVDMLTSVMEEACDQRTPLCVNVTDNQGAALEAPCHQKYQAQFNAPHLLTLPVIYDDSPVFVLVCERHDEPWQAADELALQTLMRQLQAPLVTLAANSASGLSRLRKTLEDKIFELTEVRNAAAKISVVAVILALVFVCIVEVPYRITGNFVIDAESQILVAAQRDGTLDKINIVEGQTVNPGDPLAQLDNIDLRLRRAELLADLARATAQQESAMSIGAYAELRVAEAEVARVNAELQWVDINLEAGTLLAPSAGIVLTDEELSRRLGSPISKGDVLLSIAQPQSWKVVIEIEEAEINHLNTGVSGEVTFVSSPGITLPIRVERIETRARTRASGTIFRVFSTIESDGDIWWKPGMTGIAKVDGGEHTLIWIWTHRFVDWLRLALWF